MAEAASDSTSFRSLNDFPAHLLLHILSFLPTFDAIRTTSLSCKWRDLWSSLSCLNFDYALFPPAESPSDTRGLFADFVDRTLILRRPNAPLFKLCFQFDFREEDMYCSHVDSWIRYAVNHNVAELDIEFYIDRDYDDMAIDGFYDFHFSALRNSCVRVLKLCRCDLILPVNMSTMRFTSIGSLHLDQIFLTDDKVSDLISGCLNLETLVLECCYGMKNLKICSSKLKMLSLWDFHSQNEEEESVEICAPNLRSISIVCFEMGKYSFKETPNLVEAHVDFIHEIGHYKYWSKVVRLFSGVKRLTVQNWWFKLWASKDVSLENFVLNNLNFLELQTGYSQCDLFGIAALLGCSPNLQILIIDYLFKIDKDESLSEELLKRPINFSLPSLKQVKIKNFNGTENESNFLRLLKKQGIALENIVLVLPKQVTTSTMTDIIQQVKDSIGHVLIEELIAELRAELRQEMKGIRVELARLLSSEGGSTTDAFGQVLDTYWGHYALRRSASDDVMSFLLPSMPLVSLSPLTITIAEIAQQIKDSIRQELREQLRSDLRQEMDVYYRYLQTGYA